MLQTWVDRDVSVTAAAGWLDEFYGYLRRDGRSERTVQAYGQDVRSFASWFEAEYEMGFAPDQVTGVDLRAWREHALGKEGVSPATWNRRRASLRVFSTWLTAAGMVRFNPFEGVEPAAEVELAPRWLELSEQQRFLRQVELALQGARTVIWRLQGVRDAAMVGLMLYACLREGELVQLRWRDVQIGERSGKVTIRRGKGDKGREVPLGREARRWLRLWLEVRGSDCPDALVFIGRGTDGVTERTVQRRVAEIGRLAGLEEVTPHVLRHTGAKRMLDRGTPLTVVQKILGHSRLDTTARYVQPGWSDLVEAVEK